MAHFETPLSKQPGTSIIRLMFTLFFDIDGTLLNTGGAGMDAMAAGMQSAFGTKPARNGVEFAGRTDRSIARDLFQLHGIAVNEENWETFRTVLAELLEEFLSQRQGYVLPGVDGVLQVLEQREDVTLALITGNLPECARLKLAHYRLDRYFEQNGQLLGGFGDHHLERDDVARHADRQLRQHVGQRYSSERTWIIGDTTRDIQCARAINAQVVAVTTGGHDHETLSAAKPDLLLDDLTQADRWLELLSTD